MRVLSTVLVVAPVLVAAQNCPLQFDGRIPKATKLELLDTDKSPFNANYVKGAGEFLSFFLSGCVVRGLGRWEQRDGTDDWAVRTALGVWIWVLKTPGKRGRNEQLARWGDLEEGKMSRLWLVADIRQLGKGDDKTLGRRGGQHIEGGREGAISRKELSVH